MKEIITEVSSKLNGILPSQGLFCEMRPHKILEVVFEVFHILREEGAIVGVVHLIKTDESHGDRAKISLDFDETLPVLRSEVLVSRTLEHADLH